MSGEVPFARPDPKRARDLSGTDDDGGAELPEDGELVDLSLLEDDTEAGGSADEAAGADAQIEDQETYVPPTDPVITTRMSSKGGDIEVLGGFGQTSMDDVQVEPSETGGAPGDEAIADAVRRELLEDATTTELELDVVVRGGVVRLRGEVADLADAENAEEVAGRVPGVREVIDETVVPGL